MSFTSESVVHIEKYSMTLDSILGMCGCAFDAPHVLSRRMTQVKPTIYKYSVLDMETEAHHIASFGNIT